MAHMEVVKYVGCISKQNKTKCGSMYTFSQSDCRVNILTPAHGAPGYSPQAMCGLHQSRAKAPTICVPMKPGLALAALP